MKWITKYFFFSSQICFETKVLNTFICFENEMSTNNKAVQFFCSKHYEFLAKNAKIVNFKKFMLSGNTILPLSALS